jgi:hypothetical protein
MAKRAKEDNAIMLGCKYLPGKNTMAYWALSSVTKKKALQHWPQDPLL